MQHEIEIINQQIAVERAKFGSFAEEIARINSLLDEQRGDLKLRDLIEGDENRDIDTKIGEQDAKSDEAAQTMKSFDNRKYQKPIKDRYFTYMKGFISDLKVPNLSEKTYKRIDCTISETGSDLPRALLAYYLAFIHTMRSSSNSSLCPLIIDTPVQQDQDAANAARMIETCLNSAPADMQIILGTVGLHGVKYDGFTIKTENKYHLLNKSDYEEVSAHIKPYFAQILKRGS